MKLAAMMAGCVALMVAGVVGGGALAQPRTPGQALQDVVERSCVIVLRSGNTGERLELQNICFNPRAVRISWGDGRLVDYCLNSAGEVRYVIKLDESYKITREQDILLCH